jgi:hypothetical protein
MLLDDLLQRIDQDILAAKHELHDRVMHIERTTSYLLDQAHSRYSASFEGESIEKRVFLTAVEALENNLHLIKVMNACLAVILKPPGVVENREPERSHHMPTSIALQPGGLSGEFVQNCTHIIDGLISECKGSSWHELTRIKNAILSAWAYIDASLGPNFANSPENSEKRTIWIKTETLKSRHVLVCLAINVLSTQC